MMEPTLWRTCRALANRNRLRLLREVAEAPGGLTVGEAAARLRLALPLTSQYLRALAARGLLAARRVGPTVRYRAEADPAVRGASAILGALVASRREPAGEFRALTAFTHPRRILLVQALGRGWRGFDELRVATRMSRAALRRHLAKLEGRGLVERGHRGRFRCRRPPDAFDRALLALARAARC